MGFANWVFVPSSMPKKEIEINWQLAILLEQEFGNALSINYQLLIFETPSGVTLHTIVNNFNFSYPRCVPPIDSCNAFWWSWCSGRQWLLFYQKQFTDSNIGNCNAMPLLFHCLIYLLRKSAQEMRLLKVLETNRFWIASRSPFFSIQRLP